MAKDAMFVRIDPATKRALIAAAAQDGRSLSSLVAKIVNDWARANGITPSSDPRPSAKAKRGAAPAMPGTARRPE